MPSTDNKAISVILITYIELFPYKSATPTIALG